ncbi:hypothetical protein I6E50_12750 [Roseburia hominis]|uniref:hypothetical protein n=1 Tax=Roseburia hominis TaxID=301301 RepID=UPI001F196F6F|nr:hypothetical protein [Roseburia hominis]
MSENKMTIRELVNYYVERYELCTENQSESYSGANDGLGTYITAISRIMKNTYIAESSLWDICKPENKAREISLEEFEDHCFDKWVNYIEKDSSRIGNKTTLKNDKERYKASKDAHYWDEKAEEAIKAQNHYIETTDLGDILENNFPFVSDKEIEEKGHKMMLEAIYDIFYEHFNWALLKYDMQNSIVPDGGCYNPDINGGNVKSKTQLEDYHNYIGRRKKNPFS